MAKPHLSQRADTDLLPTEVKVSVPADETKAGLAERADVLATMAREVLDILADTPGIWNMRATGGYAKLVAAAAELAESLRHNGLKRAEFGALEPGAILRLKEDYAFALSRALSKINSGRKFILEMQQGYSGYERGLVDEKGKAYWWVRDELLELLGSTEVLITRWGRLLTYEEKMRVRAGGEEDPVDVQRRLMQKVLSGEYYQSD